MATSFRQHNSLSEHLYLVDVIGEENWPNDFNFSQYYKYEEKLTSALVAAGHVPQGNWYTTEGDSFGPLSRGIHTMKNGVLYVIWYG